jgi:hypothetical protein
MGDVNIPQTRPLASRTVSIPQPIKVARLDFLGEPLRLGSEEVEVLGLSFGVAKTITATSLLIQVFWAEIYDRGDRYKILEGSIGSTTA